MRHIANDLLHWAGRTPRAPFLIDASGATYSYADVMRRARLSAMSLVSLGVKPSDRVVLLLPNGIDYLTAYYGTLLAGATAVGLPLSTTAADLDYVTSNCDPRLWVMEAGQSSAGKNTSGACVTRTVSDLCGTEMYEGPLIGGGEDIAQIIYTSGTTGKPKGVMLSHRALRANTSGIVDYLKLCQGDRVGVVLDFVYSYGNSLLQTHCRVGGSLALLGGLAFPARAVDLLDERGCTGISGVPSTFALLLRRGKLEDRSLSSLRYVTCAGGGLPAENVRRLRSLLPRVELFLMYGQTEAAARLSYLPPDKLDRHPGSIGKGMPGVDLEVLRQDGTPVGVGEEGEIVASGDNVMTGYWGDPGTTERVLRHGRLWTGDLATVDDHGFIFVTGRRNELIKTGAYRVHPKEIEDAIVSMDGIHECVVVGVPHDIWGESVVACFLRGAAPPLADIRKHLKGWLPEYKWPRRVVEIAEIPRTASGKPRRRDLARLVMDLPSEGGSQMAADPS